MKEKVFKACLKTIEEEGWKNFTFAKASKASGIPLATFHSLYKTPSDVMLQLFQKIDERVLKTLTPFPDSLSPKDKLFDLLMARLEAATPYKPVLKIFWRDWIQVAEDSPAFLCQGYSSMRWTLEAAEIDSRGLRGFMKIQGLMTLYLLTLKTWLKDESPDLGKTMAFLDRGLARLERAAALVLTF